MFEKLFDFINDRYCFVKTENGIRKFNIGTVKTFRNYLGEHEIEVQLVEEPKDALLEVIEKYRENLNGAFDFNFDTVLLPKGRTIRYSTLPSNVFFNDKKKATTLMFGKEATVVKCGKDDEYSRRIGFLEAYFQATCGLSKTKAKKYLENIVKDKEEKK